MTLAERAQGAYRTAQDLERQQVYERATERLRGFGARRFGRLVPGRGYPLLIFADDLEFAAYPDGPDGLRLHLLRRDPDSLPIEDRRPIRTLEDLGAAIDDFSPEPPEEPQPLEELVRRLIREELSSRLTGSGY